MRQAIGSVPMYNIIIVFIVITFGFLSATLSYMKAFKVNGRIAKALENHEGYNILSDLEITNTLTSIGYRIASPDSFVCPTKNGKEAVTALTGGTKNHYYCIYEYDSKNGYITYGIVTYVFIDIPLVGGKFRLPVYSETDAIFEFSA